MTKLQRNSVIISIIKAIQDKGTVQTNGKKKLVLPFTFTGTFLDAITLQSVTSDVSAIMIGTSGVVLAVASDGYKSLRRMNDNDLLALDTELKKSYRNTQ